MSQFPVFAATSVVLICLGLHALVTRRRLLRRILALNVTGSGIFLLLVSVARRNGGTNPDPVPHAMVLTGIVVTVAATALALGILRRMPEEGGGVAEAEDELR